MKLATRSNGTRDGELVVVDRALSRVRPVPEIAATLQQALDNWPLLAEDLAAVDISSGDPFDPTVLMSPLPRAYQWADGSAYVNHVELVRKARGAEMPATFWTDPLLYQGGSDRFLSPTDPIALRDEAWGLDLEAEIAVVTDDVPIGTRAERATAHIKLIMLVNDVSLRNLLPGEIAKGFGFYQSKPASAFSPVAITPDELGDAWVEAKVHRPLIARVNGKQIGAPEAGVDMVFSFADLIEHAARTRELRAGTIIGSGTVSNVDRSRGSCCIAEIRTLETLEHGEARTPFLTDGDRVEIEMLNADGASLFGLIDQTVRFVA